MKRNFVQDARSLLLKACLWFDISPTLDRNNTKWNPSVHLNFNWALHECFRVPSHLRLWSKTRKCFFFLTWFICTCCEPSYCTAMRKKTTDQWMEPKPPLPAYLGSIPFEPWNSWFAVRTQPAKELHCFCVWWPTSAKRCPSAQMRHVTAPTSPSEPTMQSTGTHEAATYCKESPVRMCAFALLYNNALWTHNNPRGISKWIQNKSSGTKQNGAGVKNPWHWLFGLETLFSNWIQDLLWKDCVR